MLIRMHWTSVFMFLFGIKAVLTLTIPRDAHVLVPVKRQMETGASSSTSSRQSDHEVGLDISPMTESSISRLFRAQLQVSQVRQTRSDRWEGYQNNAKVLLKLSAPESTFKKLPPDQLVQEYGERIHFEGKPVFFDSEAVGASLLKTTLAQYKAFYYIYDKPRDARSANIVRLVSDGSLSVSTLQRGFDTELKAHVGNAEMIRERYGQLAQALLYGMSIPSEYRASTPWNRLPPLHVDKQEHGYKIVRDLLQQYGRVQITDTTRKTALRFQFGTDGKVESTIKYLASGEEFLLTTGEKIRR